MIPSTKPFKSKKDRSPGDRVAHMNLLFDQVQHTATSIYNSPPQTYTVIPATIIQFQRADTDSYSSNNHFQHTATHLHYHAYRHYPSSTRCHRLLTSNNHLHCHICRHYSSSTHWHRLPTFQTTLHLQDVTQAYWNALCMIQSNIGEQYVNTRELCHPIRNRPQHITDMDSKPASSTLP